MFSLFNSRKKFDRGFTWGNFKIVSGDNGCKSTMKGQATEVKIFCHLDSLLIKMQAQYKTLCTNLPLQRIAWQFCSKPSSHCNQGLSDNLQTKTLEMENQPVNKIKYDLPLPALFTLALHWAVLMDACLGCWQLNAP